MKEVIRIDNKVKEDDKPVEFTHHLSGDGGWQVNKRSPNEFTKIVYLGCCEVDGDMFSSSDSDCIQIYKGHLNSGKY